jgi:hypothetical protein
MPTHVHFRKFNADGRKVYDTWLRRALFTYLTVILLGTGLLAARVLTKAGNVAEFDAYATGMLSP